MKIASVLVVMVIVLIGCSSRDEPVRRNAAPKLSQDKLDSIKEGLTLAEVEKRLGPGLETAPDGYQQTVTTHAGKPEFYRWWWDGERGIVLGFRNGKVEGIAGSGWTIDRK